MGILPMIHGHDARATAKEYVNIYLGRNTRLMIRSLGTAIALTLCLAAISFSLELSTTVYPSEDELLEALRLGEIDAAQYVILQEVIFRGVDSTNSHLLDEIPNLSFFLPDPKSLGTDLENEQASGFSKLPLKGSQRAGELRYQYHQEMGHEERARYRASGRIPLNNHFETAFKFHREFSGQERCVSRQLAYMNAKGNLNEVRLGSFSRRLGLGTIFGYRGKLLEFSDRLDEESFLFPDFGGYNGAYGRVKFNRLEIEVLSSINRDTNHTLASGGGMVSLKMSSFRPAVIIGWNRLKNRYTGHHLDDIKYGLNSLYRYRDGYLSFELCAQSGERSSWGGFITEGRHHFGLAEIKYAGWMYSDDYLDLTGGSKAGNLRHTATLDKVDFDYSDKRSGQEGGMLKSIVLLSEKLEMVNSLVHAGRCKDTSDFQFLSGLVKKLNRRLEVRLDYLNKAKRRIDAGKRRDDVNQRTRLETRIKADNLSARSYIAYNTQSGRRDYVSFFVNLRYRSPKVGAIEVWSNLARFDLGKTIIDYWYMYLKSKQQVFGNLTATVKLSHRYDRSSTQRHRTVVSLEVNAGL